MLSIKYLDADLQFGQNYPLTLIIQPKEVLQERIHDNLFSVILIRQALYAGLIRYAPKAILESIALCPFLLLKLSVYF